MTRSNRQLPQQRRRQGALTVEFALTVPILFSLILGALEFSHVNMVRNTIENAAYEGARQGIVPGASAGDVRKEAKRILSAIGVRGQRIRVVPSRIALDTKRISVIVSVPLDRNGFIAPLFMKGKTISRTVTLTREHLNFASANGG